MAKPYKNAPKMGHEGEGNDTPGRSTSQAASYRGGKKLKARPDVPTGPGPTTFGPGYKGGPKVTTYPSPRIVPGSGKNTGAGATTSPDDGAL